MSEFYGDAIALEDLQNNTICRINEDKEISNTKRYEDFNSISQLVLVSNLPTIDDTEDGNFKIKKGNMCRYKFVFIR